LFVLLVFVAGLLGQRAAHATTYQASYYGNNTGATTCTDASVNASLGNLIVVVLTWRDEAAETISSVTHNGSGTGFSSHYTTTAVDDLQVAVWVGTGITGTANVVTQTGGTGSDAFVSASLSSSGSDLLIGAAHLRGTSASPAATSPATLRQNGESVFGSTGMSATRAGSGGSTTLEFTYTNGGFAVARMILVNVANAGGGGTNLLMKRRRH
jgi:hypothetical protein